MSQALEQIQEYITKKQMGYQMSPIDLITLERWSDELSVEIEARNQEVYDEAWEQATKEAEDEIEELKEDRDKWETLAGEAQEDAQDWKRKCRELEKKISDIELDEWRAKRRAK